jgi:hypothetical protein
MIALVVVVKSTKNAMEKTFRILLLFSMGMAAYFSEAQVIIEIDEAVNEKLRMKNASIDTSKVSGYRIQIAFYTDRNQARVSENKFNQEFSNYNAKSYSLYQQPYWKIRVGDFYREIDAQELLYEIRKSFPDAFVVSDYISRPPLKEPSQ